MPVGAFEQHSSHLPLETDNIEVEYFARFAARELNAALLPTLCAGPGKSNSDFDRIVAIKSALNEKHHGPNRPVARIFEKFTAE